MMKKPLLLCAIIMGAVCANAQTIIPKAGITMSRIAFDGDDDDDYIKSKLGFTLGAALNFEVTETFSIQPELNFVQKGFRTKYSETGTVSGSTFTETEEVKLTLNYLEIPVLFKVSFGGDTKFFLNAGPSLGFGLGGKLKSEESYTETSQGVTRTENFDFDAKVKFGSRPDNAKEEDVYVDNRMDFGLQFGGGVLIANKIMIDIRYGLGLSSLSEKPSGVNSGDWKETNRVLQFTLGIPLSLK